MTPRPSGPHRGRPPSPEPDGAAPSGAGDASGLHPGRHEAQPLLRVVRGEPTAEELAALTVVVAALSQGRARPRPAPVGAWASRGGTHRRPLRHGEGGWRAAGRPA